MADSLIELSDLEDRLGYSVDNASRALAILADVSAVIRAYTARSFTVTESTMPLPVECGSVTLPYGPVLTVESVLDADDAEVDYTWTSGRVVSVTGCGSTVYPTWTHGWEVVPAEIVAVAAQMAGRAYGTNPTETGVQQESLGSYSVTLGSAAASGAVGMLPHEKAILDLHRGVPRSRTIRLGSWA